MVSGADVLQVMDQRVSKHTEKLLLEQKRMTHMNEPQQSELEMSKQKGKANVNIDDHNENINTVLLQYHYIIIHVLS